MAPLPHTGGAGAGKVALSGEVGTELTLNDDVREQTAIWQLAERVRIRCRADHSGDTPSMDRIESFASVVRATEAYLKLREFKASNLRTDARIQATSDDIARHLQWDDAEDRIIAIMDDPATTSTDDLHFETTLLRYPADPKCNLVRSELNAAACHSEFERHVASLLEQVPGVDAWTRNFRLGWNIPWYDPILARWHDYAPDFVALVPLAKDGGAPGHLVIEVKGVRDLHSEEKMRAAQSWCERVSGGATGRPTGPWACVMIDRYENAGPALTHAVNALRAA